MSILRPCSTTFCWQIVLAFAPFPSFPCKAWISWGQARRLIVFGFRPLSPTVGPYNCPRQRLEELDFSPTQSVPFDFASQCLRRSSCMSSTTHNLSWKIPSRPKSSTSRLRPQPVPFIMLAGSMKANSQARTYIIVLSHSSKLIWWVSVQLGVKTNVQWRACFTGYNILIVLGWTWCSIRARALLNAIAPRECTGCV